MRQVFACSPNPAVSGCDDQLTCTFPVETSVGNVTSGLQPQCEPTETLLIGYLGLGPLEVVKVSVDGVLPVSLRVWIRQSGVSRDEQFFCSLLRVPLLLVGERISQGKSKRKPG